MFIKGEEDSKWNFFLKTFIFPWFSFQKAINERRTEKVKPNVRLQQTRPANVGWSRLTFSPLLAQKTNFFEGIESPSKTYFSIQLWTSFHHRGKQREKPTLINLLNLKDLWDKY